MRERYVRSSGIVLNSVKFGEGHKIVRIFTDTLGKIDATAFGARKTKSRFGSSLEPFTVNIFILYRKNLESPYAIREADVRDYNAQIRESLGKYYCASAMIEPIVRFVQTAQRDRALFEHMVGSLHILNEIKPEKATFLFLMHCIKLISILGYEPDPGTCALCGKKTNPESIYSDARYGFPLCETCRKDSSLPILSTTLRFVQWAKTTPLEAVYRVTMKSDTRNNVQTLLDHIFLSIFPKKMDTWQQLGMMLGDGER